MFYEGLASQSVADALIECRRRIETESLLGAARQARKEGLLTTEFIDASGEAWRVAAHEWFERRLDDPDFGIFVFDDLRLDDLYAHQCVQ